MKDGSRERGQGLGEKIRKNTWHFAPSQPASTHITSRGKRSGGNSSTSQTNRHCAGNLYGERAGGLGGGGGGGTLQHHGQTLCWKSPCTCMGRLWGRCPWGVVRACTWRSWVAGWSVWAPGEQQTAPIAPWASQTRSASGPSWRLSPRMLPRKQDQMIKPLS